METFMGTEHPDWLFYDQTKHPGFVINKTPYFLMFLRNPFLSINLWDNLNSFFGI